MVVISHSLTDKVYGPQTSFHAKELSIRSDDPKSTLAILKNLIELIIPLSKSHSLISYLFNPY
jgi:hypothetical protein